MTVALITTGLVVSALSFVAAAWLTVAPVRGAARERARLGAVAEVVDALADALADAEALRTENDELAATLTGIYRDDARRGVYRGADGAADLYRVSPPARYALDMSAETAAPLWTGDLRSPAPGGDA